MTEDQKKELRRRINKLGSVQRWCQDARIILADIDDYVNEVQCFLDGMLDDETK